MKEGTFITEKKKPTENTLFPCYVPFRPIRILPVLLENRTAGLGADLRQTFAVFTEFLHKPRKTQPIAAILFFPEPAILNLCVDASHMLHKM